VNVSSGFTVQELYVREDDPSLFMILDVRHDPIPREYIFYLRTDAVIANGFSMVGYAPIDMWEEQESRHILRMKGSGVFGTVLYRHQVTGESFAVSMGVHNYHVWSYIVTATDTETADTVHASYEYHDGLRERADARWRSLDWFTQELSMGTAAVTIRKGGRHCPEILGGYSVTISVTGEFVRG